MPEKKIRDGIKVKQVDEYLKDTGGNASDDENGLFQFDEPHDGAEYDVQEFAEPETDAEYLDFLMELPLDEKAMLYEFWERTRQDERSRLAKARTEAAFMRSVVIAKKLLDLGMLPETVAEVTGLSAAEAEELQ